jgi:hypothetical protein
VEAQDGAEGSKLKPSNVQVWVVASPHKPLLRKMKNEKQKTKKQKKQKTKGKTKKKTKIKIKKRNKVIPQCHETTSYSLHLQLWK